MSRLSEVRRLAAMWRHYVRLWGDWERSQSPTSYGEARRYFGGFRSELVKYAKRYYRPCINDGLSESMALAEVVRESMQSQLELFD